MPELPQIEHIYQNHHMDTTRWHYFTPRDDDIVIATSYKAGTTFTQTIVGNLLFPNDDMPGPASFISPWLDMRIFPLELVLNQLKPRRTVVTSKPICRLMACRSMKTSNISASRVIRGMFSCRC